MIILSKKINTDAKYSGQIICSPNKPHVFRGANIQKTSEIYKACFDISQQVHNIFEA